MLRNKTESQTCDRTVFFTLFLAPARFSGSEHRHQDVRERCFSHALLSVLGPAKRKGREKNSRGLSVSEGWRRAECLFLCQAEEWKGVFPQPVRRPSASSPRRSSAPHRCVFSSFLSKVKGRHFSLGAGRSGGGVGEACDTGSCRG